MARGLLPWTFPRLAAARRFPARRRGGIVAEMAERYYVNSPLGPGPFTLTGAEAHHLAAVCRLRAGDAVVLFNGDGADYPARILDVGRHQVALDILSHRAVDRELPWPLLAA